MASDLVGRKKLSTFLLICFDTLDTFGKEPEQLTNVDRLFQFALSDYSINQVEEAFKIYIKRNTVMPKPADIINIIDPPPQEKKWCKVTFLEIKRKRRENEFTTNAENKYCRDFIKAQVSSSPDEREQIRQTIAEAEKADDS